MAVEICIAAAVELSKVAVFSALEKIRERASLIRHFDDDVRQLKINLNSVQAFLNDADKALQSKDLEFTKIWIREVHDAALDAEDVIELIAASDGIASGTQGSSYSSTQFLSLFCAGFMNLEPRESDCSISQMHSMALEIRNINYRLQKIKQDAISSLQTLVIQERTNSSSDTEDLWKRSEVIFEEHTSVDMETKVDEVVSLFNDHRIVSVVGMGGSGKTRLLQHVYRLIKSKFEICIWLCVSQSYSIRQLQLDVLQCLRIKTHGASAPMLQSIIYDATKDKQCFVVLDDIWGLGDKESDQCLNVAYKLRSIGFPQNQGCKILISTRDFTVAEQFGAQVYNMPLLSKDKSRELFMKYLLPHSHIENMVMTENQDKLVGKMLKKCGGLPLAIIVVAGVMKHQHPDQWPYTVQDMQMFSSTPSTAPNRPPQSAVITALRLSFNALELWVKPCFVFFGVFSEDEDIRSEKLIGMWVAEGLVASEDDGLCMLKHLSNRCLVQLQKRPPNLDEQWSTSRDYRVTIHDLVHDLVVILYKEIGGIICQGSSPTSSSSSSSSCYQSGRRILRISSTTSSSFTCPSSVRLLRLTSDCSQIEKGALANARALRILQFDQNYQLKILPKCVGKLRLLKFLDISHTEVVHNIQIEIARNGDGGDGSRNRKKRWTWESFAQLSQLQQVWLKVYDFKSGVCPPNTLLWLLIDGCSPSMTMPQEWVQHLQRLEVLQLYHVEFPRGQALFQRLQKLYIEGEFQHYSKEICFLPQLSRLGLSSNDKCEMLPLEFGRRAAFPKLEVLKLRSLWKLRTLPVLEDGAMPCLRELGICLCESLKEATTGWEHKVATLQNLDIRGVKPELKRQLLRARNGANVI